MRRGLLLFLVVGLVGCCASGPEDGAEPPGAGFVRGRLGGQVVDISGRVYLSQGAGAPYTVMLLSRPGREHPTLARDTLVINFPGRRPGSFGIGDNTAGPAPRDRDAGLQVWYDGWKWYGAGGQLDITHIRWKGEDVRELRGRYRGRFWSNADERLVRGEVTFSYGG